MNDLIDNNIMIKEIRELLLNSRQRVAAKINRELLFTYWSIGKIIVENEQKTTIVQTMANRL